MPRTGLTVTLEPTKPVVTKVPIGEWGLVEFATSASAKVTVTHGSGRGKLAIVEFDPHNGAVSVAAGNVAFTDHGTLSAQVSRFQDPAELLVSHLGSKKIVSQYGTKKAPIPASTTADKTIAVSVGNRWITAEPKPTVYHIQALVEDGHLAFEFSASRELEVKDGKGAPVSVEYEVKTTMTLLETRVPGRPMKSSRRVSLGEAVKLMAEPGLAGALAIAATLRGDIGSSGSEGGGELVPAP